MAAEVKQQKEKNLKITATGGGGILVIGGALIAAALGTAFAAHRARNTSRRGRRTTSSNEVGEIEEKDVEGVEEIGRREDGVGSARKGLQSLLPSSDGTCDHGSREFSVDGLVGIQRNNCEKSEMNSNLGVEGAIELEESPSRESKEEKQSPSIELNEKAENTDNWRGEFFVENMVRVQEVNFKSSEIARISSEGFEIAHVKKEEGTKLEFKEEVMESFVDEEAEKEGISNSFSESCVKEALLDDDIEQEEESLSIKSNEMNYQLDNQGRECFDDIVEEDQKISENHLEATIDAETLVSGSEFNMTQFKNKQSFEELKMVNEMKEKVVGLEEEDEKDEEGFKGTQGPSTSDIEFNMTQYESKQNFEEPEIVDAKELDEKDQARVNEAESSIEEEEKGLEGTHDLSISGNESDMTQYEIKHNFEESETVHVEDKEEKDEEVQPMEAQVDEEEDKKAIEEVEGTQELPISDIDFNMTQCESKQIFEESEGVHVEEKDEVDLQVEAQVHGTKSSTNAEDEKEEEGLEGTQELSISDIEFDMTQNESKQNLEKLELVLAEEKEVKHEVIGLMEAQVDETKPSIEEEDKKKEEGMEETQDLSVSGTELNMKQNFEESENVHVGEQEAKEELGLLMETRVAETKSSIEEENEKVEGSETTSTCSIESRSTVLNEMEHHLGFSQMTDNAFGIAQAKDDVNATMKHPNLLLFIDHGEGEVYADSSVKVQDENCENFEMVMEASDIQNTCKNIEMSDDGEEEEEEDDDDQSRESQEEETEPSVDEDSEATGGSEGTGDSSMESNAEAIWPTEIIEEEKELLLFKSNKLIKDNSETSKDIEEFGDIAQVEKEKEEYEHEEVIMLEKREKGADLVSMSHARVLTLMLLALGLAFGLVAFAHRGGSGLPHRNHQLLQTYHQLCRLLFPSYKKAMGEV